MELNIDRHGDVRLAEPLATGPVLVTDDGVQPRAKRLFQEVVP
ncbi:MAG: hypothetical protein ACOX4G_06375 [Limnochordia bacterium]|jgi:hypothetical protein